jgi:hypothetical protein
LTKAGVPDDRQRNPTHVPTEQIQPRDGVPAAEVGNFGFVLFYFSNHNSHAKSG